MNKLRIYRVFEKIGALFGGKSQSAVRCCCNYADNYYGDLACASTAADLGQGCHPPHSIG